MVAYSSSEQMKHQYDLQSVQRTSKIIKKPPTSQGTAGSNAQQPKVYKVKPIHFRELVQKLTGAQPGMLVQQTQAQVQARPQSQARRSTLQSVAPPPLPLHPHQLILQSQAQTVKQVPCKVEEGLTHVPVDQKGVDKKDQGWDGMTELTLSPNFQAWFNFAMLSPVSQMEQRSAV